MLLCFVLMRYEIWIEDSQKMTRKIRFDLQFFVPRRLRLVMVADTTPLNKDWATSQDLYLPSHLWNTRTRTTHKQHIKHNKHTSHHRHYTCFFNNGGHPTWQIMDDKRPSNLWTRWNQKTFSKNNVKQNPRE
jgi:hypothetical protein